MTDGLFLNLGCGGRVADGWTNVDRADAPLILDLFADDWPWEDGTVDGIVMHHVLDLFADLQMEVVLRRAHRVMKMGAVLRLSLADIDKAIWCAQNAAWAWFPEPKHVARKIHGDVRFNGEQTLGFFITQGGARKQHLRSDTTVNALRHAGFVHAFCVEYQESYGGEKMTELDARFGESFFVEAIR